MFTRLSRRPLKTLKNFVKKTLTILIDSHLTKFRIKDENDLITLVSSYTKAGHEGKNPANREYIEIEIDSFCEATLNEDTLQRSLEIRVSAIDVFVPLIEGRLGSFNEEIFRSSMWLDPQFWSNDRTTNSLKKINA